MIYCDVLWMLLVMPSLWPFIQHGWGILMIYCDVLWILLVMPSLWPLIQHGGGGVEIMWFLHCQHMLTFYLMYLGLH
jgi:hypothetical protein